MSSEEKINFYDLVCKIQILINKKELNKEEEKKLDNYLTKYKELGGDISYFTHGAGAPGNCIIT